MIQVCYVCKQVYGEKEPLEDRQETHGVCPACWPGELERINKAMAEYKREEEENGRNKN